jgi:predicted RNA-binding Zn-ribbon protein involved in translation (DUF1610 family)
MESNERFSFLRKILRTIGLSEEASDDIVGRIEDLLSEKDDKAPSPIDFPYFVRDDFLSAAELSFFLVLKSAVSDSALIFTKVGLGDLFYAKSNDHSRYRIATNRIDRKHIDFLLCDSKTLRPLIGIELDDKSHERVDRQKRDEFVDTVFKVAKLPILRVPAKRTYSVGELSELVGKYIGNTAKPVSIVKETPVNYVAVPVKLNETPACPKCGGEMVLRTAKSGSNQGEQFWGCRDYPRCHGIVKYESKVART